MGLVVQKTAHPGEELAGLVELVRGVCAGNAFRSQPRQPSDQIPVPQRARRVLHIRLAMMHRVLIFGVPQARVLRQVLAELRTILLQESRPFVFETRIERVVAGQISQIEKIDIQIDVLLAKLQALGDRADRVVEPQSRVPQQTHALS